MSRPLTDPDFAEVGDPVVELRLLKSEADELSWALSDLLCWHRGYAAAMGDNTENAPMGVGQLRELRIALNKAIRGTE